MPLSMEERLALCTELELYESPDASPDALVCRVLRVGKHEHTHKPGDLLKFDTEARMIDYRHEFAVRTNGRIVLAGLGPLKGRVKDGSRGLYLRPTFHDSSELAINIRPEEFDQNCIGRFVGLYDPKCQSFRREHQTRESEHIQKLGIQPEAEDLKARESAARRAGWRAPKKKFDDSSWPANFTEIDVHGPEGSYKIDDITRRLIRLGRISFRLMDRGEVNVFREVRSSVLFFAEHALHRARLKAERWPQQRLDADKIERRVDRMLQDITGFLEHVELDQAELFSAADDNPPDDENEPGEWILGVAKERLIRARDSLESSRIALEALRRSLGKKDYQHDGATHVLAAEFLAWMSISWRTLTEENPGKTGRGLFNEFCIAAWGMLGWKQMPEDYFSKRIERGVHRSLEY